MSKMRSSEIVSKKSWTKARAIELGNSIFKYGQEHGLPIATAVFLDDQRVFHLALDGTSAENDIWIERKRRTVDLTKLSSLEYRESLLTTEITDSVLPLTDGILAFCGGGYPLFDSTGYRGVAIVSGLPHIVDDEVVSQAVRTLAEEKPN